MLTVSARDFGPIAAGTVDLKPLTIFMGRSNTGKSFMAAAIYALMTASYDNDEALYPRTLGLARRRHLMLRGSFAWGGRRGIRQEIPGVMRALRTWMKARDVKELESGQLTLSELPRAVQDALEQSVSEFLTRFGVDVIERLRQTYGEASGFVRRGKGRMDPRLTIRQDYPSLYADIQLSGKSVLIQEFDISQIVVPSSTHEILLVEGVLDKEDEKAVLNSIFNGLEATAIEHVLMSLSLQSFYLPAARSGIAQGHKVLAASLVRQSRRIGLEPVNIPTLPGITTEFLSHIIGLDRRMARRPRKRDLVDAIDFIENEVLQGRIDLDESNGLPYPEIVYEQTGIDPSPGTFTLDHTSSMVSELAPLVLFLKYLVTTGNLLILEEPESHLHPGAQRQMARGIARLVNAGIKVIITTHSDMFVAQINNLLRLSYASKRWIKEHKFLPQDCLNQDQISASLFHYDKELGGSVITPLAIDSETGIDEEEFVREIELVYDEAIALQRILVK